MGGLGMDDVAMGNGDKDILGEIELGRCCSLE